MKRFLFIALTAWLLASCAAQERVLYIQDLDTTVAEQISSDDYQIRFKPLDRITVVVNSQNPELAAPFNTASSYNSLSGTPIDGRAYSSTTGSIQVRTIDANGMLDMPIIGKIYCTGKTRSELGQEIARKIIEGGHISDPTVNIQYADMNISVVGEVARPGQYTITKDRISLFDAISMAGDLTVYGQRQDVTVIREENGKRTYTELDLTSKDIFSSPCYYLQQNDVVYVKPNKYKAQAGEVNQHRSFYLSMVSTLVSVATLIITLIK